MKLAEGEDLPENWVELEQEWENEQEDEVMRQDASMMHKPAGGLSEAVVEDLER